MKNLLFLIPILLLIPTLSFAVTFPTAPTVTISNITSTGMTLSWSPVSGATEYSYAVRQGATTIYSVYLTGTNATITGLQPNQYYQTQVVVIDNGVFGNSTYNSFETLLDNINGFSSPTNDFGYDAYNHPIPLDLGSETVWQFNSQDASPACFSYGNLGGHTINSIQGSIGIMRWNETKGQFSETAMSMILSPVQIQSNVGSSAIVSNPNGIFPDCQFSNGTEATDSRVQSVGAYRILGSIYKMMSENETNQPFDFENMNVTVPNGWYLIDEYTTQADCAMCKHQNSTTNVGTGATDFEIQAHLKISK